MTVKLCPIITPVIWFGYYHILLRDCVFIGSYIHFLFQKVASHKFIGSHIFDRETMIYYYYLSVALHQTVFAGLFAPIQDSNNNWLHNR